MSNTNPNPKSKNDVSSTQKGSAYERELQKIYESMLKQDLVDAKVERRVKLRDSEGRSHEIDLYWKFRRADVLHQVVVQAKDYASKIKISQLIEFHKTLELLPGQPVGLFITRTGFQKGAFDYANDHGIGLLRFRKPSDYRGSKKKPIPDIKVKAIKHIHPLRLHIDLNWINEEKERLQITEEKLEQAKRLIVDADNNMNFYDEDGHVVTDFWAAMHVLYPDIEQNPTVEDHVGRAAEFTVPTFVLTKESTIPRLKVNAITIKRIMKKSIDSFEIAADNIIRGILENLASGEVRVFNNEFRSDGSFTLFKFDTQEFRFVD